MLAWKTYAIINIYIFTFIKSNGNEFATEIKLYKIHHLLFIFATNECYDLQFLK